MLAQRQFHSTVYAILAVHNDIVRAVDQGVVVAVVLLDLSSAINTVDSSAHSPVKVFTHRSLTRLVPAVPSNRYLLLDQVSLNPSLLTVASLKDPYLVLSGVLHTPTIPLSSFHHTTFTSTYMPKIHCRLSDTSVLTKRLTASISDLAQSLAAQRLQLNRSKTKLLWFRLVHAPRCQKMPSEHCSLSVRSSVVPSCGVVRNLGVLFDSKLFMKQHVNKWTSMLCWTLVGTIHELLCGLVWSVAINSTQVQFGGIDVWRCSFR